MVDFQLFYYYLGMRFQPSSSNIADFFFMSNCLLCCHTSSNFVPRLIPTALSHGLNTRLPLPRPSGRPSLGPGARRASPRSRDRGGPRDLDPPSQRVIQGVRATAVSTRPGRWGGEERWGGGRDTVIPPIQVGQFVCDRRNRGAVHG